jgi:hypothetical protein
MNLPEPVLTLKLNKTEAEVLYSIIRHYRNVGNPDKGGIAKRFNEVTASLVKIFEEKGITVPLWFGRGIEEKQ